MVSTIGVEALNGLASKQAYGLLQALALKSSKKLARQILKLTGITTMNEAALLEAIPDLHVTDELKGIPRSMRQLQADPALSPKEDIPHTLEKLVRLGAIRRGLYLECSECGAADWYPLDALDETIRCTGCRNVFPLPVVHGDRTELQFHFRLNTLFNRVVDQDVVPCLLTLHHLAGSQQASCRCLGLELVKDGQTVYEFDVVFVAREGVFGAECKASGALGDKDIKTALCAAQLGFERFGFATVAETWDAATEGKLEALRRQLSDTQMPMTVSTLSAHDLFGAPLAVRRLRS